MHNVMQDHTVFPETHSVAPNTSQCCTGLVCSDELSAACRGGIRTLMITGDYQHTALAVAKDVGMIRPDAQVIVIDKRTSHPRSPCSSLGNTSLSDCPELTAIEGAALSAGIAHMASDNATAHSLVRLVLASKKKKTWSASMSLAVANLGSLSLWSLELSTTLTMILCSWPMTRVALLAWLKLHPLG